MSIEHVVGVLRCPHCGAGLALAGGSARCPAGHSFDVSRQGYLNLLPGDAHTGTGDTPEMVEAREAFLGGGHYGPIAEAVAHAAGRAAADGPPGGCVVDIGAGTGHYLAHALDRMPDRVGLALDLSKHAARRAARSHPRAAAVVCDAWQPLPLAGGAAALALSVFAPRNGAEITRILRPGGALVVVTPTARHLRELIPALGLLTVDERKQERLDQQLGPFLTAVGETSWEATMSLAHGDVEALAAMGPSARHIEREALAERVRALPDPLAVTASVTVSVHRRR